MSKTGARDYWRSMGTSWFPVDGNYLATALYLVFPVVEKHFISEAVKPAAINTVLSRACLPYSTGFLRSYEH
jgi:hypothetical protein